MATKIIQAGLPTTGPAGPAGPPGGSVVIKGSVATSASLPGSGNATGDGWIATDTGHLWVYGTSSFADVGLVRGPAGVDGTQGPQGNPGSTGGVGPAGGTALTLVDKTANFTLALADVGKHYQVNSPGAVVATIPTNAAVAIPIGSVFTVIRRGAGGVTFAGSVGVTVNSPYGYLSLSRQFSSAAAIKVGTDEWDLFGDLA